VKVRPTPDVAFGVANYQDLTDPEVRSQEKKKKKRRHEGSEPVTEVSDSAAQPGMPAPASSLVFY
jgi:hypothetical protein